MPAAERFTYGQDELNYADLRRASGISRGTVILIHGGFWRFDPTYFDGPTPMAEAFAEFGWNVWQIEYRALGARGGWPATLQDVAAAANRLADLPDLDLGRVITVGHSAGGHLATWLLGEALRVDLAGAASLAGVVDLRLAERDRLSRGVVADFLGGSSAEVPERFNAASPAERPAVGRSVRLIHGLGDDVVPPNQSEAYLAAALRAGQDVTLETFDGDHFDIIDVAHPSFALTRAAVHELTSRPFS
jgi:acetyl esterase/lipase